MAWPAAVHPVRQHARVLTASVVGTSVEYYDFFIYGTAAALFFGPVFFPAHSSEAQQLLALISFAIAFVARPLGALAFGHFGDRIGRKSTLVASLLLMGGCTLLIAFLPTYAMIGWVAPALLCLIRFVQGFAVGGEWAGAALLSIENAPPNWRARFGMTAPLGVWVGKGLGYGLFLLLGLVLARETMMAWGWRVPFLASAILVFFGLWVRLKLPETPEFRAFIEQAPPPQVPIVGLLTEHPWRLLTGGLACTCAMGIATLAEVFALAQAAGPLGYSRNGLLLLQLVAWPFGVLSLIIGATWADRTRPERTIGLGAVIIVPVGLALGAGLGSGSLLLAGIAICAAKCAGAFTMAGMGYWLSTLFPVRVRYSGVALASAAGAIFGQGLLPVSAQLVSSSAGMTYVGLLPAALGLSAFAAVRLVPPRTFDTDLACEASLVAAMGTGRG